MQSEAKKIDSAARSIFVILVMNIINLEGGSAEPPSGYGPVNFGLEFKYHEPAFELHLY